MGTSKTKTYTINGARTVIYANPVNFVCFDQLKLSVNDVIDSQKISNGDRKAMILWVHFDIDQACD